MVTVKSSGCLQIGFGLWAPDHRLYFILIYFYLTPNSSCSNLKVLNRSQRSIFRSQPVLHLDPFVSDLKLLNSNNWS